MASEKRDIIRREETAPRPVERTSDRPAFSPAVDIYETEAGTVLLADMPGVAEQSIEIRLEDGVLSLTGRVEDASVANHELTYAEYQVGDYQRSFSISDTVDQAAIGATFKNGVLRVVLPKAKEAQPRKIEVKSQGG
jgi:HSP20 family molecular chaperone IbpA